MFEPKSVLLFDEGIDIRRINSDKMLNSSHWSDFFSRYRVSLEELAEPSPGFSSTYMLMYADSTYPSPEHPSYIELTVLDSTQQTIEVKNDFGTLHIQPFANMRGGIVAGNDSLRPVSYTHLTLPTICSV